MNRRFVNWMILVSVWGLVLLSANTATAQTLTNPFIYSCKTISQPGQYTLIADLHAKSTDYACLTITAQFVTVDLGGHTIFCDGATNGITNTTLNQFSGPANINLRNGTVTGCGSITGSGDFGGGIILVGHNYRIESMQIISNGNDGIYVARGSAGNVDAVVKNNLVSENAGRGLVVAQPGGNVQGNTVTDNGDYGLVALCPGVVVGNTATGNFAGIPGVASADINTLGTACTMENNYPLP